MKVKSKIWKALITPRRDTKNLVPIESLRKAIILIIHAFIKHWVPLEERALEAHRSSGEETDD